MKGLRLLFWMIFLMVDVRLIFVWVEAASVVRLMLRRL